MQFTFGAARGRCYSRPSCRQGKARADADGTRLEADVARAQRRAEGSEAAAESAHREGAALREQELRLRGDYAASRARVAELEQQLAVSLQMRGEETRRHEEDVLAGRLLFENYGALREFNFQFSTVCLFILKN